MGSDGDRGACRQITRPVQSIHTPIPNGCRCPPRPRTPLKHAAAHPLPHPVARSPLPRPHRSFDPVSASQIPNPSPQPPTPNPQPPTPRPVIEHIFVNVLV